MESESKLVVVSEVANGLMEDGEKKAEELETELELVMADEEADDDKDGGFEFSFDCSVLPASPVSADVMFRDWKMKQSFALMVSSTTGEIEEVAAEEEARAEDVDVSANVGVGSSRRKMTPLRQLMEVEKPVPFSSSSSDADEFEPLAAGRYSFSNPATAVTENGGKGKLKRLCKRWSLHNLLRKGDSVHEESGGGESAAGEGE